MKTSHNYIFFDHFWPFSINWWGSKLLSKWKSKQSVCCFVTGEGTRGMERLQHPSSSKCDCIQSVESAYPPSGRVGGGTTTGGTMVGEAWYFGRITRDDAERLLLRAEDGDFIVRDSESNVSTVLIHWIIDWLFQPGDLSITLKAMDRNKHFKVRIYWLFQANWLPLSVERIRRKVSVRLLFWWDSIIW